MEGTLRPLRPTISKGRLTVNRDRPMASRVRHMVSKGLPMDRLHRVVVSRVAVRRMEATRKATNRCIYRLLIHTLTAWAASPGDQLHPVKWPLQDTGMNPQTGTCVSGLGFLYFLGRAVGRLVKFSVGWSCNGL